MGFTPYQWRFAGGAPHLHHSYQYSSVFKWRIRFVNYRQALHWWGQHRFFFLRVLEGDFYFYFQIAVGQVLQ